MSGSPFTPSNADVLHFLQAARMGLVEKLQEYIAIYGTAIINVKHESFGGHTALMLATHNARYSAVQVLLEAGVDPNIREHDGWTALMFACVHNNPRMVEMMLEHGANMNLLNHRAQTARELAMERGYPDIAVLLDTWEETHRQEVIDKAQRAEQKIRDTANARFEKLKSRAPAKPALKKPRL